MAKVSASSARVGRAGKSGRPMRRRGIDFSDIPEASPAQLRAMRRVGRPPLGVAARRLIAIRIDPQVLGAAFMGWTGAVYLVGAVILGLAFVAVGAGQAWEPSALAARRDVPGALLGDMK